MRPLIPTFTDGAALLVLLFLLPGKAAAWQTPSGWHVLWLILVFIWFCLSVYLIRKLKTAVSPPPFPHLLTPGKKTRFALAIIFSVGLMLAISHQLGYLNSAISVDPRQLGSGESAAFFVFAPGAWLGVALLYLIFLGFEVRETIERPSGKSDGISLFSLLGVNGMLLAAAVELRVVVNQMEADGRIISVIGAMALLLLLFAPPRLIYLGKEPRAAAAVSFIILLLACAWQIATPF